MMLCQDRLGTNATKTLNRWKHRFLLFRVYDPIGNMVSSMGEAATIESLQYLRNASQTHAGKCVHIQLMTPQVRRNDITLLSTHHSLIQWRV